MPKSTAQKNEK